MRSLTYKNVCYLLLATILIIYTAETVYYFGHINAYVGDEVWYATASYNILKVVFHVNPPQLFPYPSTISQAGFNASTYIDAIRPPLGKYLMAIPIALLGYAPYVWRISSWAMGDALIIVAFLLGSTLYRKNRPFGGLAAALLVALDPVIWAMHGIGMLDIYASFFILLTFYFIAKKNRTAAAISLGLAFASKETSYLLVVPFVYFMWQFVGKNASTIKKLFSVSINLLETIATVVIAYLPIIYVQGGFVQWFEYTIVGQLHTDTHGGHIASTAVYQISNPLGWFINFHPFYLGSTVIANSNAIILSAAAVLTVVMLLKKKYNLVRIAAWAWTVWFMFVIAFALGNNTVFSFYTADFSSTLDVFVAITLLFIYEKFHSGVLQN